MCVFHLSLSFISLGHLAESRFFSFCRHETKKTTHNNNKDTESGGQQGVRLGISGIASSSLGDKKKGHPKRQALWELTLALGRFPFDFEFFFEIFCVFSSILIDFGGF